MAGQDEIRNTLLSGNAMVQHHTSIYEVQAQFNRLVSPDELDEARQNDLSRMKEEFRRLLSQERVNKSESISMGVWENDHHRVRITRVEGKWQPFGYEDSTGKYVECYEALFLIEMNRLMVTWNDVVVSIEQGYSLFLGRPKSLSLEEYHVYSLLNRASYYVLRFDPARQYQPDGSDFLSAEERCVWGNLYDMLHQPNPREGMEPKANGKLYETVRRSMLKYGNLIRKPPVPNSQEGVTNRREGKEEPDSKKFKLAFQDLSQGIENVENDWFNVEHFRRMFDRFDIVRGITEDEPGEGSVEADSSNSLAEDRSLQIVFDLFAPESQSFKKSYPPVPIARVIVRKSSLPMPYIRELQSVYKQQNPKVSLMLMLVSDYLTVHCFLYDIRPLGRNIITLPDGSSSSR